MATRVESEKKAAVFVEAWLHSGNLIRWDGPIVRPAIEKALADLLDAECAAQAATIARLRAALEEVNALWPAIYELLPATITDNQHAAIIHAFHDLRAALAAVQP